MCVVCVEVRGHTLARPKSLLPYESWNQTQIVRLG